MHGEWPPVNSETAESQETKETNQKWETNQKERERDQSKREIKRQVSGWLEFGMNICQ